MNANVSPAERVVQESPGAAQRGAAVSQQAQGATGGGIGALLGSIASLIASYTLPAIGWRYIFAPFLTNSGWGGIPVFLLTSVVGPILVNQIARRLKSNQEEEEQKRINAAAVALLRGGLLSEKNKSEVTKLLNARERYLIISRAIIDKLPKDAKGDYIADEASAKALNRVTAEIDNLKREAMKIIGQQYDDKTLVEEIIEKTMQEATESQKNEIRRLANEEAVVQKKQQLEQAAAEQQRQVEELKKQENILNVAAANQLPPYDAAIDSQLGQIATGIVQNKRIPTPAKPGTQFGAAAPSAAPSASPSAKAAGAASSSQYTGFKSYPAQTGVTFAPTKSDVARAATRARNAALRQGTGVGFDFGQPGAAGTKFGYASPTRIGGTASAATAASRFAASGIGQRQGVLPASIRARTGVVAGNVARARPFGTASVPTYPSVAAGRGGTPLRTPPARLGTPAKSASPGAPFRDVFSGRNTPSTVFKGPSKKRQRQ